MTFLLFLVPHSFVRVCVCVRVYVCVLMTFLCSSGNTGKLTIATGVSVCGSSGEIILSTGTVTTGGATGGAISVTVGGSMVGSGEWR